MPFLPSLLLIGPTGAGKSPLGGEMEKQGLSGKRVHHFDFGANLRGVAQEDLPFPEKERALIKEILSEGRLLKPEEFFLAEKLLNTFLSLRDFKKGDFLLLNGLPRNLYQAERLSALIDLKRLIYLRIDEKTLLLRLKRDPAGDRYGREDDLEELVSKKLKWFRSENLPLLEYYASRGIKILEISVNESDTGFTLYQKLLKLWGSD